MGIPITYFRSSSYNAHRFCPMQFYIEYVLGWRGPSNKKADIGTIVHKILEICAICKYEIQQGNIEYIDEDIGTIETANYDETYLDDIINKVYNIYTSKLTHHSWMAADLKGIRNSIWKVLKYRDGMFDPRNRYIVGAEQNFDFLIEEDWAKYKYEEYDLEGYLGIKGTIDLITDIGDNIYEIIDWKNGRRLDWATGKEKDIYKLYNDPQLRLYHYAAKRMYPNIHTFIITIIFINDGGAFSVHFDDNDLDKTQSMIRKRFEFIQKTEKPEIIRNLDPQQGWKCSKLCHAGKTTFNSTSILPIIEHRPLQFTAKGKEMTKCEQIRYEIAQKGIKEVTEKYTHPEYNRNIYKQTN